MNIPVMIEPNFSKSLWSTKILSGFEKNKITYLDPSDIPDIRSDTSVLIIGSSCPFITDCVDLCSKSGVKSIVIGSETDNISGNVSCIEIDRKRATADMLAYFHDRGVKKTALLGISRYSGIDLEKRAGFVNFAKSPSPEDDIYYCDNDIDQCIDSLIQNIHEYDAVICSNDYFAIYFIIAAEKCNIRVPDDIMVSGFGDSYIGRKFSPSVTSVAPNYSEMGRQACKLYSYLAENPEISSCSVNVNYDIIIRESTGNMPFKNDTGISRSISVSDRSYTLGTKRFSQIIGLDMLMGSEDRSIINILCGIARGTSYSKLAEQLYLSDTALHYKLNKIFAATGIGKKSELQNFLNNIFTQNNDWGEKI